MKKINNNLIMKALIVFLMIQPIFDLSFFYGQIATLIRIFIILTMLFFTLKLDKGSKLKKYFLIYLFVVFIYLIFHDINCRIFTSLVPGNFNYNTIAEICYVLKMLMSLCLLYIVYKSKLRFSELDKPLNYIVLFIALSIIVLNLLGVSYSSYGNEIIKGNFFAWFTDHHYLFSQLSSRGYFAFTNQIVAILLLYLPIIVYFLLTKFKPLNIISFLSLLLSMLMMGTRIAVYGTFLTICLLILIYIILVVIKQQKFKIVNFIALIVFLIVFYMLIDYSPVKLKEKYYNNIYNKEQIILDKEPVISNSNIPNKETNSNIPNKETNSNKNNNDLTYIKNNYQEKLIYEEFIIKRYPYQYDTNFWINIMKKPIESRVDTRFLEIAMVKRITDINNNKIDYLVGIGYNRVQNIFNIERDYIMQYYCLGIIGVIIFLGAYFVTIIYSLIVIIRDFKNKFIFKNIVLLSTIIIMLLAAYFSGNLLNGLGCIIPLSIICGVLLNEVNYVKINTEKLIEVKNERQNS
ncbi:MAG: O-antigen ligase family protein [Bacilli bacterium]